MLIRIFAPFVALFTFLLTRIGLRSPDKSTSRIWIGHWTSGVGRRVAGLLITSHFSREAGRPVAYSINTRPVAFVRGLTTASFKLARKIARDHRHASKAYFDCRHWKGREMGRGFIDAIWEPIFHHQSLEYDDKVCSAWVGRFERDGDNGSVRFHQFDPDLLPLMEICDPDDFIEAEDAESAELDSEKLEREIKGDNFAADPATRSGYNDFWDVRNEYPSHDESDDDANADAAATGFEPVSVS
jgi:hypothetical protein